MAKIAIIGAGDIGKALCKLFLMISDHELLCVEPDALKCLDLQDECDALARPRFQELMHPTAPITFQCSTSNEMSEEIVSKFAPEIVLCACDEVEFFAQASARLKCNFIAFCDDYQVVRAIEQAPVQNTFVLQAGVAPGLLNYMAMDVLNDQPETRMLTMIAGSLPDIVLGETPLTKTKNTESLLADYLLPAIVVEDGQEKYLEAMSDISPLRVSGVCYETFISGTGIGNPMSYDVPNVCYRVLNFPGHSENILAKIDGADDPVNTLLEEMVPTSDDYMVLIVIAENAIGQIKTSYFSFGPSTETGLEMSANTLAAACSAAGIAQLILEDQLPSGFLDASHISMSALYQTNAMSVFDQLSGNNNRG